MGKLSERLLRYGHPLLLPLYAIGVDAIYRSEDRFISRKFKPEAGVLLLRDQPDARFLFIAYAYGGIVAGRLADRAGNTDEIQLNEGISTASDGSRGMPVHADFCRYIHDKIGVEALATVLFGVAIG